MNNKSVISYTIILSLALQMIVYPFIVEPVFAMSQMSLEKATQLALLNSDAIDEIELDILKKNMERQQAVEGLRDIRKKESTVRFSLLFSISFPEKHGMPKEIELIMKIPKVDHEIDVLNHKLEFTKQKIMFDVRQLYLDLVLQQRTVESLKGQLVLQKDTQKRLESDLLKGNATQDDVLAASEETTTLETNLAKESKKLVSLKEKLGAMCKTDMLNVKSFDTNLYVANLNRNDIRPLIRTATSRDFDFYTIVQERKLGEKKVDELVDIYRGRYGSKVNRIMPEIKKSRANKAKFLKAYNAMLDDIDRPWTRVFKINLLFFTISIPFRWFQGEYTALRYFEDQKYALFVAVLDRDKLRVTEAAARAQLEEKIKGAYDAAKELELAYKASIKTIEKEKKNYNSAFDKNKLGMLSFAELESARLALVNAEQQALSNLINYNKFIHTLDFYTVGGLKGKLTAIDFDSGVYEAGDSIPIDASSETQALEKKVDKPTWVIEVPYTEYRFSFGIFLPSSIEATHFQLELEDGRKIGEKTEVKKRLEHMPILFSDSSVLRLKLYKDKALVYEALLDGTDYAGTLDLKPADQAGAINALSGSTFGTYKLIENQKTNITSLFLTLGEAFGANGYALINTERANTGETKSVDGVITEINKEVNGLSFVMLDHTGYILQFYLDETPVFTGRLKPGSSVTAGELEIINATPVGGE